MSHEKFKNCIDLCYACATSCEHCASEDLKEEDLKMMVRCIQLDRECAAICRGAAHVMSLGGSYSADLCAVCAKMCDDCAAECEKHGHMDHCKECASMCRKCAAECRKMSA